LIQLLKEEFGGGEEILPTSGSSNHASSSTKSTTVEEPQASKQEGHASLVPEDPADSAVRSVPVPVASAGTRTYQVRPRDTLGGIAKKFGVSAEEIKSLNQIQDPKDLRLGQTLRIPAS
jgi:LysM repeat protein